MKKSDCLLSILFFNFSGLFSACTSEDHQKLPPYSPIIYSEDFQTVLDGTFDETPFVNFAESGTKKWMPNSYRKNGYYEFSPFNSNENLNIGWFITPGILIDSARMKRLTFQIAQHHVVNMENNFLKVFISTDFTGNIATANWTEISFKTAETGTENNYTFFNSGNINLTDFSGKIHIAFKATGGTANTNAGAYMIDNIKIF